MIGTRRFLLLAGLALWAGFLAACNAPAGLPDILYLAPDPAGRIHLFRQAGSESARLISAAPAGDVIDFAAAPDGRRIVYSVLDGSRGALRLVDAGGGNDRELLACPDAECSGPVWSPDGARLVYERRPLDDASVLGSPRLMWLAPDSGETTPLVAGEVIGYGARFSPDGAWLSYVSPADEGVVLYHLAGGTQRLISGRVGRPAAFSPDSSAVVVSDIVLVDAPAAGTEEGGAVQESSRVYLYRVALTGEGASQRQRLSPDQPVDDSAPAWSPDGEWIAFGRLPADTAAGRQLWLMRADGSEARPLTDDPAIFHGPPAWSPDGSTLLYQRYALDDPAATPEVWQLRLSDGAPALVAASGYLPAWLPGD